MFQNSVLFLVFFLPSHVYFILKEILSRWKKIFSSSSERIVLGKDVYLKIAGSRGKQLHW